MRRQDPQHRRDRRIRTARRRARMRTVLGVADDGRSDGDHGVLRMPAGLRQAPGGMACGGRRQHRARQRHRMRTGADAHDRRRVRAVAEHVRLADQPGLVLGHAELRRGPVGVGPGRTLQIRDGGVDVRAQVRRRRRGGSLAGGVRGGVRLGRGRGSIGRTRARGVGGADRAGAQGVGQIAQHRVGAAIRAGLRHVRCRRIVDRAHLRHVVRATGLRARPDRRTLPAAERLAADDRARDVPVDVGVAHLHLRQPRGDLGGIQRVDAAGQPVVDGVLPLDGRLQIGRAHDAQHRAEALREVEPRAGLDVVADARRPDQAVVVELARRDQPLLAGLQRRQSPAQLVAGRLDQRSHVRGQIAAVADAEGLGGVEDLPEQTLGLARRADEDDQRPGRALLPGMAECRRNDVARRQVRVRCRGDDDRVLAAGLRQHGPLGTPAAEQRRRLGGAGEDHRIDVVMRQQRPAGRTLVGVGELDQIRVRAGVGKPLAQRGDGDFRHPHHLRRGRNDHRRPRRQRRDHAADGNGDGEVPRRRHNGDAVGRERDARLVGDGPGRRRVVADEVDGLADLGIGLGDGLARPVDHGGDEGAAARRETIADGLQHRRAAMLAEVRPRALDTDGAVDDAVDVGDVLDQRRLRRPRILCGIDQVGRPLAVGGQCGIGVGFVSERRGRRRGAGLLGARGGGRARCRVGRGRRALDAAVLRAARDLAGGVALGDGLAEPLLLPGHRRLRRTRVRAVAAGALGLVDAGHRVEEILLRGVFLQTAHQVAHGDVEAVGVDDGGVQDQTPDVFLNHLLLHRRHALQHLGVDLLFDAPGAGKFDGRGHGEQIVAGDAHAEGIGDVGAQRPIEQAQVVGVGLRLRRVRRAHPAVQIRGDGFHGQVRALDQADLDRGAAAGDALLGEVDEPVQRRHRIRQVRLEDDAGLEAEELVLGQDPLEYLQRQVEVVVLLHVQVDERRVGALRLPRRVGGDAVERAQRLHQALDAAVEVPGVELGDDAGGLDRHVVDQRVSQQRHRVVQAALRLLRTEHRLAEEIEIELAVARTGVAEQLVQGLAVGVEHQVADELPHALARDGHDQPRELRRHDAAELHGGAVHRGQERGRLRALGHRRQLVGGGAVVLRPGNLVDERHGVVHARRIVDELGQLLGGVVGGILDGGIGGGVPGGAAGVAGTTGAGAPRDAFRFREPPQRTRHRLVHQILEGDEGGLPIVASVVVDQMAGVVRGGHGVLLGRNRVVPATPGCRSTCGEGRR